MECPECLSDFNETKRLPKALPCGHTFCLECLEKVDRCYIDQKEFPGIPCELPINHNVRMMTTSKLSSNGTGLRVWCLDCKGEASDDCIDECHKVCSRKKIWMEEVLQNKSPENKYDSQYYQNLVDSLDEAAVADAMEILTGRVAPVDVLLEGPTLRWRTSLQLGNVAGEENDDMLRHLFALMHMEGTVPKEMILRREPAKEETKPIRTDPETVLDLTNLSTCHNQKSVKAEKQQLLSSDQLLKVRHVLGLYCDKDKNWSLKVLKHLAPVLEEVHIYNFDLEHLDVVATMPQLRWLVLDVTRDNTKEKQYEFPTLNHKSKVEFLWLNLPRFYINRTLFKSIISAYQSSLQVLLTAIPTYHSDAVEQIGNFKFPNLVKLFYHSEYCGSDNCRDTMNGLRKMFPNKSVVCFSCGRTEAYDE